VTQPLTTIELFKENMKFSAGHFTIFSATERENLHGHNFTVYSALTGVVRPDGLMADYGIFKDKLSNMCHAWNETFLLPDRSPHLTLDTSDPLEIKAHYGDEVLKFLPRDVTIIPVSNTTLEEMSRIFGERLIQDISFLRNNDIMKVTIKIASGPGQWACWNWIAPWGQQ
jgi:6-pyruvoyltetrahydropterin/6-carboxytetrahydropterin synthase